MNYYHGSDKLFDKFDERFFNTGMGSSSCKVVHLTPHKEYAKNCAKTLKERNGSKVGYVYEVSVKGQEDLIYNENMSNICLTYDSDIMIVSVEEV